MRALLSRSLWSMSSSSSRCAIPSSLSSSSSYSIPSYAGDASSSSLSSSRGDGGAGGGTYDDDRCPIRRAPPRIVVVVAPARRLRSTVPIRTADDANRDRGTRNANLHRGVAVDDIDDDDNDDDIEDDDGRGDGATMATGRLCRDRCRCCWHRDIDNDDERRRSPSGIPRRSSRRRCDRDGRRSRGLVDPRQSVVSVDSPPAARRRRCERFRTVPRARRRAP